MFILSMSMPADLGLSKTDFLRVITALWIALMLSASPAHADEAGDLAARAMELSGTRATLEGTGKSIDAQMATDPRVKKMTNKQRTELASLLKDTLDGRRMAAEVSAALAATNDVVRLRDANAIMDEPVFQKLTRQTVVESLKASDKVLVNYARSLGKRPPDPERLRLIQRLDAATDGSRIIADMRYEMATQLLGGLRMEDREARLAEVRAQIEAAAPEEYALRALYVARKISTKDMETYVHTHENETMGWLSRQIGYGTQKVMLDAMGRMVSAILEVAAGKR